MANTLKFKRGLLAGLPAAAEGEPLFTTDTADLYIGTSTGTQKFQKFIASGATTQILRGDGSLFTFPLTISSPTNGQVLKYNGTAWVNDSDAGITGSGSSGQVAYFTGATTQAGNNNLFWDITNSRLGVGTNVPSTSLHVVGQITGNSFIPTSATIPVNGMYLPNTNTIAFSTNTQQKLILDATGNLGLGVVLKSWGVGSSAFELGNGGIWKSGSRSVDWIVNGYNNGTNYIYNVSAAATFYRQFDGSHQFWNAPSGTAGNTITFTQAMTLTAAGRLLLGTTSEATNILEVVGDTRFSPTGTSLTITGTSNFSILTANQALVFRSSGSTAGRLYKSFDNTTPLTGTVGNNVNINGTITFSPTSGTATYTGLSLTDTINQTGGSNGITRGLYVNPTLTSAADWRSIETSNNTGWSYYGAGTANSYFGGNIGIGVTPTSRLHISTTTWNSTQPLVSFINLDPQGVESNGLYLQAGAATSGAYIANFVDYNGVSAFYVRGDSNIGIGTSSTDIFSRSDARSVVISASGTNDNMSLQLNAGVNGGRGAQIYMGAGGVRYFTIGTNVNETLFGTVTSTPIIFFTNNGEKVRLFADGNFGINTGTTNTGERLQVNGTMKVTGAATFGGNTTLSLNQNSGTFLKVQNTTSGTGSYSEYILQSDASAGNGSMGKLSSAYITYKILTASSTYIYNGTAGDISIINDFASGAIKMSAGASSTAHFTIASTGIATFASSVTSTQYRLSALNTAPATASSTGTLGEIRIDADHIYVCTATNTWKRVAIATF